MWPATRAMARAAWLATAPAAAPAGLGVMMGRVERAAPRHWQRSRRHWMKQRRTRCGLTHAAGHSASLVCLGL